jgi:hypothetical protein
MGDGRSDTLHVTLCVCVCVCAEISAVKVPRQCPLVLLVMVCSTETLRLSKVDNTHCLGNFTAENFVSSHEM